MTVTPLKHQVNYLTPPPPPCFFFLLLFLVGVGEGEYVYVCVHVYVCIHVCMLVSKLQALVYDILPSTTAVFSYAIGSRKLSANEQFFC